MSEPANAGSGQRGGDLPTRRQALCSLLASVAGGLALGAGRLPSAGGLRLATFSADVTPPLGHPLMGGGIQPATRVDDPLSARGFVLLGAGQPLVLLAVDWCEIRNEAHDRWREASARAAETSPDRVLVTSVHQHDAPIADLEAERILERSKAAGRICDLDFHERTVERVARAIGACLTEARQVSRLGMGQARVERVASNRRFLGPDGRVRFSRTSSTQDPRAHEEPEGTIDPWLKTLSFWDGDRPLLALSAYATHPMSYYGKGGVSADFVGLARRRREEELPGVAQVYVSGASGNVTAGKYNDGAPENRTVLAERLRKAMADAWRATERRPVAEPALRVAPFKLEPRSSPGFRTEDLERRLASDPRPFGQCLAALGLSWRKRMEGGGMLELPALDFGYAQIVLLPGESYVEHQLLAQRLRPESFVLVAGYGECGPGYVPTDRAFEEKDTNLDDWCWVAPGSERALANALGVSLHP